MNEEIYSGKGKKLKEKKILKIKLTKERVKKLQGYMY